MLERSFEIIVRLCPEEIFGKGWELRAQQLSLPSGRIDLLLTDNKGVRHVVELKKGCATRKAIEQVLGYAGDLSHKLNCVDVVPWVVAHEIPSKVASYAAEAGVHTKAVSLQECKEIVERNGITEGDLLGRRKDGSVISGGSPKRGLRNRVPNEIAYADMPIEMADVLRKMEKHSHMDIASGNMQTVIYHWDIQLGGVNRKHRGGVAYIVSGMVLTPDHEKRLGQLGFERMTKTQKGSNHEHSWWETSWRHVSAFVRAVEDAKGLVDRALGS
ncbi:MAG: DUF91 domain-containing protein [Deltaproteobacteria bacterium]|nr:DUF91 domain-containing protein [Deltaproteobacteria bacterium]